MKIRQISGSKELFKNLFAERTSRQTEI